MVDIGETVAPKSDQLNAEDLLAGPRTFTIERVTRANGDQPIDIHLVELPGRPFKPCKTMRRVLIAAWGREGDVYAGRRLTLFRDPAVRFGGDAIGGVRISHLSHIDKPLSPVLTVTRGKRAPYAVAVLKESAPAAPSPATESTLSELADLFTRKGIPEHQQVPGAAHVIGRQINDLSELTDDDARKVMGALSQRADVEGGE